MFPIIFQIGPLTVYSFGAFMALAALCAAWVVQSELKRKGYNPELASTIVFAAAIGGVITSFLLELIVYPAIYEIWKDWEMRRLFLRV